MIDKTVNFFKQNSLLNLLILGLAFSIPLIWSRYLNANYVSAKFFMLYLVSSLSLLVSFRKLVIPQLPRMMAYLFVAAFAIHFLSPFVSGKISDLFYLLKFFSFCFLTYYFYSLRMTDIETVFKKTTYVVFTVVLFVIIFACKNFYNVRIVDMNLQSGILLGSFGNVNMMAEFLVLTTPFVFYWVYFKDRIPYFIKLTLFVLWVFFIMYCRSRSTWIGLSAWALWELIRGGRRKGLLISLIVAYGMYYAALTAPVLTAGPGDIKLDSLKERINIYKATGQMIVDNPLGVGVGHFDSYLVPYQLATEGKPTEFLHYDQPHSEVLRWTAQFGWIAFVIFLWVTGWLAWILLIKRDRTGNPNKTRNFLGECCLVLAPQIFFQFPYFNPASLLFLAFVLALFMGLYPVRKERVLNWKVRGPIFFIAVVGMLHAVIFVGSIYLESTQSEDYESVALACDLYPINQNACFLKTYHLLKDQKYPLVREQMEKSLDIFEYHRGIVRLLPTYLKNTSGDKASCEAVWVYNTVFPQQKFFDVGVLNSCKSFAPPIVFKDPKQFIADYKYWLNRQLQK